VGRLSLSCCTSMLRTRCMNACIAQPDKHGLQLPTFKSGICCSIQRCRLAKAQAVWLLVGSGHCEPEWYDFVAEQHQNSVCRYVRT
jgi:hypothetical protein